MLKLALEKGIEAASAVEQNKAEISQVFNEVKTIIEEFVQIELELFIVDELVTDLMSGTFNQSTGYELVSVKLKEQPKDLSKRIGSVDLFRVKSSKSGYPITVRFEDIDEACFDKPSFEECLSDVMSHSQFGLQLLKLQRKVEQL